MPSKIPVRFGVALVALVLVASVLVFCPAELPRSGVAVKATTSHVMPLITLAPPAAARAQRTANVPNPPGVQRARPGKRSSLPANLPDEITGDRLIHTVRPGESVESLARRYLAETTYMTTPELEAAIRQANAGKLGRSLHPGDRVMIPGYETALIVEHPTPMAKAYEVRAIYLTGFMAGSQRGIEMIRDWRNLGGNAIVFDIKDSDGSLTVPFDNPLAPPQRHHKIENLPKFARFLHSLGLHGIARIAVFRDEELVTHHPGLAVRSRKSGQAWRENGKLVWTDPSSTEVQDYNLALAKLAAHAGIDEIQFDYIRFPAEGDQQDAEFHFQKAHPDWPRSKVIVDFLSRAYSELHPLGVLFSVDVFGVMAWQRPIDLSHTGQDIAAMARHCDLLSPMVYPSHFFGMDGYAHPGDAPEHFISESMERFKEITAGSGVVLRPWLQAFGWRTKTYSSGYIIKQVDVAKVNDGVGYMFWNARNDYSKPFLAMPEMRVAQTSASPVRASSPADTKNTPVPRPASNP